MCTVSLFPGKLQMDQSLFRAIRVVAADPGRRTEVVHVEVAPVVVAARADLYMDCWHMD